MGHLYFTELGNPANGPLTNAGDFLNLQANSYWTSTLYPTDSNYAFVFGFHAGVQGGNDVISKNHILAVREISVVPEPISSTLFMVGAATLGFRRFRKTITS